MALYLGVSLRMKFDLDINLKSLNKLFIIQLQFKKNRGFRNNYKKSFEYLL